MKRLIGPSAGSGGSAGGKGTPQDYVLRCLHWWCFLPSFKGKWLVRRRLIALARTIQQKRKPIPIWLNSGLAIEADMEQGMSRWVITNDIGENETRTLLTRLLRPSDNVIDVGSNIGYFALLCAQRVFPGGRVVAFEPGRRAIDQLRRNVALNSCGAAVDVREAAVGRGSGVGYLRQFEKGKEDMAILYDDPMSGRESERVNVTSLDQAVQDLNEVRLLKIDVQGRERDVLLGGQALITSRKPILIVEMCKETQSEFGYHPHEIAIWLEQRGYGLLVIGPRLDPWQPRLAEETYFLDVLALPISGPEWPLLKGQTL